MIARSYIQNNLNKILRLYNQSSNVQTSLFYSKLAILELCGWIEISMDDIVIRLSNRIIKDVNHRNTIRNDVIGRTFGFEYNTHFRKMLISIVGFHGVEKMEKNIDNHLFIPMVAELHTLKSFRDKNAHEYIKGTTLHLDAPSVTIMRFNNIYNGLVNVDRYLRTIS